MDTAFGNILVPIDFGPHADAALDYARLLADKCGAQLHLLHVVEDLFASDTWTPERWPEIATVRAHLVADADRELSRRLNPAQRAQLHAMTHVVAGRAADVIVQFAKDRAASLIVMGTHGRTGVDHLLMGSVAEHVIRFAPCPVLTVRDERTTESIPGFKAAQVAVSPSEAT